MDLPLVHRGKVRELYDAGDDRLVMVASDRISVFDVVLDKPVPDKGRVLTALSLYWFDLLADVANHVVSSDVADFPDGARDPDLAGRAILVRRLRMVPLECIVRGWLSGSAWREYRDHGTVHGEPAPTGLRESDQLPEPRFTPSTKAAVGEHDENLTFAAAAKLVGDDLAEQVRALCLDVYRRAAAYAAERGIVIADTKFELGLDDDGTLRLADEVLTPDSSRFWPADAVEPGRTPPSFDKEPVRAELAATGWDKRPPPPPLSPETVAATRARYVEVYQRLTGQAFGGP